MVYWILLQKSFMRNLQYKVAHLINNAASAIFGFVFIAIWTGVLQGKEQNSPYGVLDMTYYIAAVQCILWVSGFFNCGTQYSKWGAQRRHFVGTCSTN